MHRKWTVIFWALWSLYSNIPGCIQLCCGGVVTLEPWQSALGLQNSIICLGGEGGNPLMKLCLMPERSACIHSVRSGQLCAVHKMITGFQSLSLTNMTSNPRSLSLSCLSTVIASCSQLVKGNTQEYKWFISASACVPDST